MKLPWSLVIIGPIPGATLCSFKQDKVEFIEGVFFFFFFFPPTGLAALLKIHPSTFSIS